MIANLDGDFETVDYAKNRNLLLYDNIQYFDAILKYIDKNYTSDITLESLADIAGYSKYHFSRMFKKYMGKSFVNFLSENRINAAIFMLIESNMSITDIAMRSGFASLTTFNRTFKNVKGVYTLRIPKVVYGLVIHTCTVTEIPQLLYKGSAKNDWLIANAPIIIK